MSKKIMLPATAEQWLKANAPSMGRKEAIKELKQRFGIQLGEKTLYRIARELGTRFRMGGVYGNSPGNSKQNLFTADVISWLKDQLADHKRSVDSLMPELQSQFGIACHAATVRRVAAKHGIKLTDHKFHPGQQPWNVGKSYSAIHSGSFRPGHEPHTTLPVGTERQKRGYWYVKTAAPNEWTSKGQIEWEKHNNKPLPDGHMVRFQNGDTSDFSEGNLVAMPYRQNIVLNRTFGANMTPAIRPAAFTWSAIEQRIHERKQEQTV